MTYRSRINLNILKDSPVRDNIRFIKDAIEALFGIDGSARKLAGVTWEGFVIDIAQSGTGQFSHGLKAVPTDAILTWVEWKSTPGTFTWVYSSFTADKAVFSCTQPAIVRGMIGRR